ncbi:hypothetical protein BGW38_008998, partial [Lunasporangiospora selenospora]
TIEKIIEACNSDSWSSAITDTENMLVSWDLRHLKGNLCFELVRLYNKQNSHQLQDSIHNILSLAFYQRCMFGESTLALNHAEPNLVERAFGRIKIIQGHAITTLDEPFVFKAVEVYYSNIDKYFQTATQRRMDLSISASNHGSMFEQYMMSVLKEALDLKPLSDWPHDPPISDLCPALVGKTEIVGWVQSGLQQGITHKSITMEEFMDAHVNHQSTWDNRAVPPFFFPKSNPSGPDLVFFLRIDGTRVVPVFVQLKLHQKSSRFADKDWRSALSTVSAPKIMGHAKGFRKFCPEDIYISLIIAYPTEWTSKLPALRQTT